MSRPSTSFFRSRSGRQRFYAYLPGLLLAAAFLLGQAGSSDKTATTEDGKKVLLRDTGTWIYLDEAKDKTPAGQTLPSSVPPSAKSAPEGRPPSLPASGPNKTLLTVGGAVIGVLVLLLLALILHFTVLVPAKKRKPLGAAFAIISGRQEQEYGRAEELLTRAITSGLKKNDVQEAYFARAYVRAVQGNFDGAAADLSGADRSDPAVLYLDLWVRVRQEKYKDAFDLYEKNETTVGNFLKARELMSIACFSLGREHWKSREIDEAIPYFDKVRSLGPLADRVPSTISDHQVTLGIVALFDDHFDAAEKHFEEAKGRAAQERRSSTAADLGLLLCQWRKGGQEQLDGPLSEVVDKLEKELAGAALRGEPTEGAQPEDRPAGATGASTGGPLLESGILKRNTGVWHAVSLLHSWRRLPKKSGLTGKNRDILEKRLRPVMTLDPDMPDPPLLLGLIDYYFFHESKREDSLRMLESSKTTIPEVELLLKREKKLMDMERDKLKTFFAIVRDYVADKEVPPSMKKELIKALERFPVFKTLEGDLALGNQPTESEGATVQGLESRGALLHRRLGAILKPLKARPGADRFQALEELMDAMPGKTKAIKKYCEELEKDELHLMINAGEFLLKEEDNPKRGPHGQN